ncbi:MAG: glycerophosphodiester phosphodiesterase [Schleiferilactobacillus harbinensis]|nr:glycerophosphodiester phosphodiesterase [Schleiferilactobacillus harbinensis]MCI1913378.1 glycerophosphodiester phosphodiesterase [Schleiferilactobacillus harbinensis]
MRKWSVLFLLLGIYVLTTAFVVVGHRGDPLNAPEETFQSIDSAFTHGANYVELDVHVSQDNVLVVSHDRDLYRVTNTHAIVSEHPFAELQKLHQANGEPIHSLDEVFAHFQSNPKAKFLIETKKTKHGNPKNMEALLVALIQKYHMENRVMVHSFSYESLAEMKKLMPAIPRIFIAGSLGRLNFERFTVTTGVNISSEIVTPQLVNQLHYIGQKVYVWDEMTEKQKHWDSVVNLPIDGVVTNYPEVGHEYQQLKGEADLKTISDDVAVVSDRPIATYENPYALVPNQHTATPGITLHATQYVAMKGRAFYQVGENTFVDADYVNPETLCPNLVPFVDTKVQLRAHQSSAVGYNSPTHPQNKTGSLRPNRQYTIDAIKVVNSSVWVKTDRGWVNTASLLLTLPSARPTQFTTQLSSYFGEKAADRIALLNLAALVPGSQLIKPAAIVSQSGPFATVTPGTITAQSIKKERTS